MLPSRKSRPALLIVLGAALAAASLAPAASATERYASPAGSGTDCTSAKPCDITRAIMAANYGDDVTVNPGSYPLTETIDDPGSLTIHGVAGQPRPRLEFYAYGNHGLQLDSSTLRWVEVDQEEPGEEALHATWAKLDQVVVRGADAADCALSVFAGTARNTVVVSPAAGGSAICSLGPNAAGTSDYRNVTAIATGSNGVAIEAYAFDLYGTVTANLVNVIARGGPGGAGLWIHTDSSGAHATITATHTNYANYWTAGSHAMYFDFGGNQGTAPQFANPAAGDYRQAAGSVTIGAGLNEPINGAFDVDGDPRMVGTTDIGADEFVVAPTAITGPAAAVSEQAATLSGTLNPKGAPTSYHFEYGTTTAYGSTTPTTSAGSGMSDVATSATVGGLTPETTYHYRIVASNAAGVVHGGDQTFTTGSSAQATQTSSTTQTSSATPATMTSFAGVKLVSSRLTLAGGFIAVRLKCPVATAGRCTGRTKLTARRLGLGSARFSIAAGAQAKVRVRVSPAGRRLFARTRRMRGRAATAAHSGAGESKTTVAAVRIRRRPR
jgi:hypothetical protein